MRSLDYLNQKYKVAADSTPSLSLSGGVGGDFLVKVTHDSLSAESETLLYVAFVRG